jgi:hypothetical protein
MRTEGRRKFQSSFSTHGCWFRTDAGSQPYQGMAERIGDEKQVVVKMADD